MAEIEVRPARSKEARRAADLFLRLPARPGAQAGTDSALLADSRNHVVAVRGKDIVGSCVFAPSPGRCAIVLEPHLLEWDADLAARLLTEAAAQACRKGARLIQSLTGAEGDDRLDAALAAAGFAHLAVLSYMRRPIRPADHDLGLPADIEWRSYSRFRRRLFAEAITATYEGSLDCPGLAGLRTVRDALATHKNTGEFHPKAWNVALVASRPVGVELVNNLYGRGELVYLGVAAAARGRGIGRALLARAIRDTAAMGLPRVGLAVDTSNEPAVRLYEGMGFQEIRRRLAWFVPRWRLDECV